MNNFYYALNLLDILYGISISEDQFEEIALIGWGLIGNKRTRLYRYRTYNNKIEGIELPCNCDILEAVTSDTEEWDYVNNHSSEGNINSAFVESYIENRKQNKSPLYIEGKLLKYERVNNTLYIRDYDGIVNILYKGIELDENGLPNLTDKEATALATYCAYIVKFKEGISSNNPNIINFANSLQQKWNLQVDQARVDYYMSQNEWDQVLDVKTSWNRKQHNRTLKLYR